jgi:uncharacterized protein YqhQ
MAHCQHQIVYVVVVVGTNILEFLNTNELNWSAMQLVDRVVGVQNVFGIMWTTLGLFKAFKNFNLLKFDELMALVIPFIQSHARSTNEAHVVIRWSIKLT